MKILNLTQHAATAEQTADGVFEPMDKELVKYLLTFDRLPSAGGLEAASHCLAAIALEHEAEKALIGGAPFLMAPLELALRELGIIPVYAFSVRESTENLIEGAVVKTNVFKHVGFYEVRDDYISSGNNVPEY